MAIRFLTLHQPWASLIAIGAKTIETRGWSTDYRGPLAIHAAVTTKTWSDLNEPTLCTLRHPITEIENAFDLWRTDDEGRDVMDSPYIDTEGGLTSTPGIWLAPIVENPTPRQFLPLGAIIALVELVDVRPITDSAIDGTPTIAHLQDIPLPGGGTTDQLWEDDGRSCRPITSQLPFGDYTPGRFAHLYDDIRPVVPIPMKGAQGLRQLPPDIEAQLREANHG